MNVEQLATVAVDCGFGLHRDVRPSLLESVYETVLQRRLELRGLRVHAKQLLTYLRLMNLSLGLLFNFGGATFREGVKRVVNSHAQS